VLLAEITDSDYDSCDENLTEKSILFQDINKQFEHGPIQTDIEKKREKIPEKLNPALQA
jgi:hypothetical protein